MSTFSYVYVLVSKPGDTYYEQALISVTSLRHCMPYANIFLLVDSGTEKTLFGKRSEIRKYISKLISVELPENLSNKYKSRWLKTSMYNYIDDDFLFIDTDTIITGSLEEIETMAIDLGAVLDKHALLSKHCTRKLIENNAKKMDFQPSMNDKHFNSGVLLVRKTGNNAVFFAKWHELWLDSTKKGLLIDQAALAQTNYMMDGPICELPGIWNCQIEYGMQFIENAKIFHMFVTGDRFNRRPHVLMDPSFYKKIEQNGLTEDAQHLIQNPLDGFKEKTQVIGGVAVDYFNTYLSRLCCLLYCSSSRTKMLFDVLNWISENILTRLKRQK